MQGSTKGGRPIPIIQTESRCSPPVVTLLAGAVISAFVAEAMGWSIRQLKNRIEQRARVGKEMKKLHEDLFGFLTSSQFVIGERFPDKPDIKQRLHKIDAKLAGGIALNVPFKFDPEVKETDGMKVDYAGNICSVGHALSNNFSGFVLGDTGEIDVEGLIKEYLPKLRWQFNYERDPRARGMKIDDKRTLEKKPPLNWIIVDTETKTELIPYFEARKAGYVTDYLLVVKTRSPHEYGRYALGSRVLVVAGCHPMGTAAFSLVLDDESILREIHSKVGNDEFEAVFEVQGEKDEPESIRLIGVEPLS